MKVQPEFPVGDLTPLSDSALGFFELATPLNEVTPPEAVSLREFDDIGSDDTVGSALGRPANTTSISIKFNSEWIQNGYVE